MQRSIIARLPEDLRKQLDQRIIKKGFAGYRELADWLSGEGYEIRKSAVHKHGQKLEERLKAIKLATEQARAIVAESPDSENTMNDALVRLLQERVFQMLVDLEMEDLDGKKAATLARGIASLARASVTQKKWADEYAARLKTASERVTEEAKRAGLSSSSAEKIRAALLGAGAIAPAAEACASG
ncbi:MAG TPA: DUF3486 family protein [Candidatus Binataceae bacterium]|nr:DUF3486 family protein [Candidatus Binataceae bacterium]